MELPQCPNFPQILHTCKNNFDFKYCRSLQPPSPRRMRRTKTSTYTTWNTSRTRPSTPSQGGQSWSICSCQRRGRLRRNSGHSTPSASSSAHRFLYYQSAASPVGRKSLHFTSIRKICKTDFLDVKLSSSQCAKLGISYSIVKFVIVYVCMYVCMYVCIPHSLLIRFRYLNSNG